MHRRYRISVLYDLPTPFDEFFQCTFIVPKHFMDCEGYKLCFVETWRCLGIVLDIVIFKTDYTEQAAFVLRSKRGAGGVCLHPEFDGCKFHVNISVGVLVHKGNAVQVCGDGLDGERMAQGTQ